ncbi:MAG: alpha/beta hydrolase-fold protein [Fidelibacterota bacterium]
MRKYIVILFLLIVFVAEAYSQLTIDYMKDIPIIDGLPDDNLKERTLTEMTTVYKTQENNFEVPVYYFSGYTDKHFYLYIEADADQIIERDRAYQNGDGFHLMIGKPQPDNAPTDEFYILGFSPQKNWSHKMVWYYNIDLSMRRLGDEVLFATNEDKGKIGFELLLPWQTVKPYHPWFGEVGINLCFVKAIGQSDKNYYFITMDEKMQSEQSLRNYELMAFDNPGETTETAVMVTPGHVQVGGALSLKISKWTRADTTIEYTTKVFSGENERVGFQRERFNFKTGFNKTEMVIDQLLILGGYRLEVKENGTKISDQFVSVFPAVQPDELQAKVRSLKPDLSAGTYHTMMFYIENLAKEMQVLKPYENSYSIRSKIIDIEEKIRKLEAGENPIIEQTGTYRRAFLSKIDSTLRPYSVYVPEDYSPKKEYPLLVYLHGSGNDDRVLAHTITTIKQGFIILAPNGRGTSNCYATEESQTDIMEAIEDVTAVFNINESAIILSGFSMGGYGVYRTYYEHPELFSAIAVLSGHPNLAQKWGGSDELNFFEEQNLKKFNGVPIFIYHGREDLNCPFDLTEKLVEKMKDKNFEVTFVIGEKGHGGMSKTAISHYHDWLRNRVRN